MARRRKNDPRAEAVIIAAADGMTREMRAQCDATRRRVQAIVFAAGRDGKIAASAAARERAYRDVLAEYHALAELMGYKFGTGVEKQNKRVADATAADLPRKRDTPRPLTREQTITALNGKTAAQLVATATENMSRNAVLALRRAAADVFARAAVEGMTDNEIQKALQDGWEKRARNKNNFRFVDKSGRAWENARYLQMLTRTTLATISRNAEINTLARNGYDLARISSDGGGSGDCEACARWEGAIVSLTGATKGYPTLAEAEADGLFHPNCVHRVEYIAPDEIEEAKSGG